jgi:hypothetical protein
MRAMKPRGDPAWKRDIARLIALAMIVSAAHAETADVKYRGPVDLKPFKCDKIERSSFIREVCYGFQQTSPRQPSSGRRSGLPILFRWCQFSCGVNSLQLRVVGRRLILRQVVRFVQRLEFEGFVGQARRCLAHIELAGHDVGD